MRHASGLQKQTYRTLKRTSLRVVHELSLRPCEKNKVSISLPKLNRFNDQAQFIASQARNEDILSARELLALHFVKAAAASIFGNIRKTEIGFKLRIEIEQDRFEKFLDGKYAGRREDLKRTQTEAIGCLSEKTRRG